MFPASVAAAWCHPPFVASCNTFQNDQTTENKRPVSRTGDPRTIAGCRLGILYHWQPNDEARAEHAPGAVTAILGGNLAVQGLDDLPADRQAKARMLAELFSGRSFGVETIENVLQVGIRNAGAFVLDAQLRHAAGVAHARDDPAAWRAERLGVANQVAQHLHQAVLDRPDGQAIGR